MHHDPPHQRLLRIYARNRGCQLGGGVAVSAPERIWVEDERGDGGQCHVHNTSSYGARLYGVEYIRTDIHEAEVARLRALLAECADDLSGRVGNDWPEMLRAKYPSIEAKYRRDMDIVYRARAALGDDA